MIGIASAGGRISLGFVADRVGKLLMVRECIYVYVCMCVCIMCSKLCIVCYMVPKFYIECEYAAYMHILCIIIIL